MSNGRGWAAVLAVLLLLLVPLDAAAQGSGALRNFVDIQGHWAEMFIRTMRYAGVLEVPEDGRFGPDEAVTRGDVTLWLARALELSEAEIPPEPPFSDWGDIAEEHRGLVLAAHRAGLVTGYQDGTFRPGRTITRLEIATLLGRALTDLGVEPQARYFSLFTDGETLPDWGLPAAAAVEKGIIVGNPRNGLMHFDPAQETTRAQAITMVERFATIRIEIEGLPRPSPTTVVPAGRITAGYYINGDDAYDSLTANGRTLDWLVYWSYEIGADGALHGTNSPRTLGWGAETGRPIFVLLGNHDRSTNTRFLNDPTARARAVRSLKALMDLGYSGVNVDFEDVPAADRQAYTTFIQELVAEFRPAGYLVTLSVPAKTRDVPESEWTGAFDYAALGRHADYIAIMTYDFSWRGGSPGPIGPVPWMESVIKYAVTEIPARKILLGLPAYGYDWPAAGGAGRGVTARRAVELAAEHRVSPVYDPEAGESSFRYVDESGQERVVYFTPAMGLKGKLRIVETYDLAGVALWRVGQETADYWPVLRELSP